MNKRGLSPVIISLILIVLALVAVGILWGVISNLISKQSKEISLGKLTLDAKIKGAWINEVTNSTSVLVRRKSGAGSLAGFKFIFNNGTDNEVHTVNTSMKELEERVFSFTLSMSISNVLTITLIPLIKFGDKEIFGSIIDIYNVKIEKDIEPPSDGNDDGNVSNGNISLGYKCSSCNDCNNAIANANSGDIIYLNISLNNVVGTCIDFNGKDNIIFDCQGNTIDGDGDISGDGIVFSSNSNNNTVRNCNISEFRMGITLDKSDDNTMTNIISSSNYYHGFYFYYGDNNTLTNSIAQNSVTLDGVALMFSQYNVIKNNYIKNNQRYGIAVTTASEYNIFYNNHVNNTDNYRNFAGVFNYFNTTKTSGTNIVNGIYIGGNYWAHPDGTGFSETCIDSDNDDICDSSYNIESYGDYDYLPLL